MEPIEHELIEAASWWWPGAVRKMESICTRLLCLTSQFLCFSITQHSIVGRAMWDRFGKALSGAVCCGFASIIALQPASAADMALKALPGSVGSCSEIVCENGQQYPLCPTAVSVAGEIVTASLYASPNAATHVRLVPMGVGYRYAGRRIWLDGFRDNALLNFGRQRQIACTIQQP